MTVATAAMNTYAIDHSRGPKSEKETAEAMERATCGLPPQKTFRFVDLANIPHCRTADAEPKEATQRNDSNIRDEPLW